MSLLFILTIATAAVRADTVDDLLAKADGLKSIEPATFASILDDLDRRSGSLPAPQLHRLQYLKAWSAAYSADYATAIPMLRSLIEENPEPTLRFRTLATTANVLSITRRYEEAFARLEELLNLLPQITDPAARQQGLGVASYLYAQVGLDDIAVKYAGQIIQENWAGLGLCRGGRLKLEAIYKAARLEPSTQEMVDTVDACTRIGDVGRANFVRVYAAENYMRKGRYDLALTLLDGRRDEIESTHYKPLISLYDSLLARIYREVGKPDLVRKYALSSINYSTEEGFIEPLVPSYRLLYLLARERGDLAAALDYHEKYAAADKGYLDELSARQFAYEKVKHQSLANQLQIDALNKQNEVLQLQQALDKKAVEASRLYIVLLLLVAAFIALFAYRTKRSQLHFMKLSQQDGLTGIANRPHFIKQADAALAAHRKTGTEVCAVLCDLDYFKSINDRYGHAGGDLVLKQVVAEIRRHLRANDIFGRVGGEEFGVLLPGCSLEAARERCEQLRAALDALKVRLDEHEITTSASFGIETTASCGYELRQLLANADAALYQAKDSGRNCVVAYDPSMANTFTSLATGRLRAREHFGQDFASARTR
ncbi:MAG TPA: GGDEF domain-containing protein [Povalibacter sp.]|uniref:tetratricopeptide repeat-containing diguanylate cyclase n=1 Tax=Povalibacter sp. TaxID=1962978 RepID=UPI002B95DD25|nr:GGDEF domain-containing protein [Povalibacter sp.]HMN45239.1 GGDEF domain-containing protein [Povalibacter sp.]